MMTDRPILFNGAMVNAIIEGRKTQTRRVINPQPEPFKTENGEDSRVYPVEVEGRNYTNIALGLRGCGVITENKLRYVIGDRLYVREAWTTRQGLDETPPRDISPKQSVGYIADDEGPYLGKFRQGMHMPRWASRLTLLVADVRVQRLRDISDSDAMAEGIEPYNGIDPDCSGFLNYKNQSEDGWWLGPKDSFRSLWGSINGPDAWDENPWLVAVSFDVHHCNIDQCEGK